MSDNNNFEDKIRVSNFLIDAGCCKRCVLRFLGETDANYDAPELDLKKFCFSNLNDGNSIKKFKSNPCIVCLDLLSDNVLQSMLISQDLEKVAEYDCDTFVNYISYPTAVLIREHSLEIHLEKIFPSFFKDLYIVPLNRAWSLSIQNKLTEKLNKKFDKNSNLQLQFTTFYKFESEEMSVMFNLENKLQQREALSRNFIGEFLKNVDSDVFRKHVPVPPLTPTESLVFQQLSYKHDYIFIAGRYCKYSRNMFQTPWVADDAQVATTSVQEIIFEAINNTFNGLVFSSSGREDFDVRSLGRGRPFFVKICDPKTTKVSPEKFRLIEEKIKLSNAIKVQDLQFIDKKFLNNIKEGEQFKKKTYKALCIIDKPENLDSYIQKINNISSLKLKQKTPLRVFHRRSADVREREIYHIEARPVEDKNNLFELNLVTQAGTYVKEFVHGDLGRTQPSLSEIIGGNVDIIALDVLEIHLDFPPPIKK